MRRLLPPHLFLICLILAAGLHYSLPLAVLLDSPWTLIGLLPLIIGVIFLAWGSGRFINIGTNLNTFNNPDILVTGGPFRLTRNPMYLGFTLVLMGVWLLFGSLTPSLGVLIFASVANYWYIPFEERRCEEIFGEDYLAYRHRVRRWL